MSNDTPSPHTFTPHWQIVEQHKRARNRLWSAIKGGHLERKTECEVCGSTERVQAHHEDYSKPLDVRWLCIDCHFSHHGGRRGDPR